jgi:DNA-binding MarR family transcriptional regulator
MEHNGLIRRIRDPEKKRSVQVEMTKQGEEIHRNQKNEVLPRILGHLSEEERKQLWAILKKLREATYAELAPQPSFP